MGKGAQRLGLHEPIHPDDAAFESLRTNRRPDGSGKLTPRDGADRVRFFDFQCSAQKSVSVLAVTLGDSRLLPAHDAAAKVAFQELEKFAARQANTAFMRFQIRMSNLVAAVFRHTAESGLVGLTEDAWLHNCFATEQGLALEKAAVEFIDRTCGKFSPLGGESIALPAHLSAEQRAAATAVLESRDQVICLRGTAGVGKTTVLKEIHRSLAQTGVPIFCCAPTSSAVDTLRRDGVPVSTLSQFLRDAAPLESSRLAGAVLICDEAGLTSTEQGAELLRLAQHHTARVLFLGDTRQHTSVEAGDFLRVLETYSNLHGVELTAIRRQEHKAYRSSVRCLAAGAARVGLERLDEIGWVKESGADYVKSAAQEFLRLCDGGRQLERVFAVTPTWAEHESGAARRAGRVAVKKRQS